MDLRGGYWQVPEFKNDGQKAASVTLKGLFQLNVILLGSATYLRPSKEWWKPCFVIFSLTFADHLHCLAQVLSCFHSAGLQLNSEKCIFGTCLGHLLSSEGIHPDPDKPRAMENFPTPATPKNIRTFLRLCMYYRKFIFGFSDLCEPLNDLLHSDSFRWGPERDETFRALKSAPTTAPVLGHFVEGACTVVQTDASGHNIRAVLVQTVHHVAPSLNVTEIIPPPKRSV